MFKRFNLATGLLCAAALPTLASAQVAGVDLRVEQVILIAPSQGAGTLVRVTVTNIGTEPAGIFQIVGGVTNAALNTVGGAGAACAKGRNAVYTCGLTGLAPGLSTDIIVSASVDRTATSFSSRAATSGAADVNFSNNSSTVTAATLTSPPDVQMSGSASTRQPRAGESVVFTYLIKAAGGVGAGNVGFTAALPPDVQLVGASTSQGLACDFANGIVSCPIGDIASGGQAQVFVTIAPPAVAGVTSSVSAVAMAGDGRDTNLSNNSVTLDITPR